MKEYIKKLVDEELKAGDLAGASICVIKNGATVLREDYGYADLAAKKPMPANGIFRLYSLSKPVTAVAAMILLERGELDLLDPVSKYLDGFCEQRYFDGQQLRPVKNECTIHNLLNMTSGIVYPDVDEAGSEMNKVFENGISRALQGNGLSTIEFCNEIGRSPLAFEPGTHWRYGASADVLGAVIEVVSGKPFRQFLMDEIFSPLGMTDTDFYVPADKQERMVTLYLRDNDTPRLTPYTGNNLLILDGKQGSPSFESGGAGLFSTISDYSKFAEMLLTGCSNGINILGRKTLDYLHSNQLTPGQRTDLLMWPHLDGYGYGNLMRVLENTTLAASHGSVGEFGWDGWAGSYAAIDPTENLVFLYFISRIDEDSPLCTRFRRRLRSIIYSNLDSL